MQPAFCGFSPFGEQQQQAKAGVVAPDDEIEGTTLNGAVTPVPLTSTVAAAVVEMLRASEDDACGLVLISKALDGRAAAVLSGSEMAAAFTAADAVSGTTASAVLTPADATKATSTFTNSVSNGTGIATAINAEIATSLPAFSAASLLNRVEDIINDGETDVAALAFVDQVGGKLKILTGTEAAIAAAYAAALASSAEILGAATVDCTSSTTSTSRTFGE